MRQKSCPLGGGGGGGGLVEGGTDAEEEEEVVELSVMDGILEEKDDVEETEKVSEEDDRDSVQELLYVSKSVDDGVVMVADIDGVGEIEGEDAGSGVPELLVEV